MHSLTVEKVGDKARQSVKWSFSLQIIQKIIFFASSIVLARILTPKDFGISAIAITFDTIIWVITSFGINSAIIHFQDNIEERLNAGFWLFLVSAAVFVSLQVLLAPMVANFYHEPVLADILRVTAIAIFIFSLGAIQKTILIKNIEFKKISILDTILGIIKSSLYMILALLGFGVWSFIYPKVIISVISTAILWNLTKWRPKLEFNFKYWIEMFRYGKNVLFSNIVDYFINNSSYILIGSLIGSTSLGIYTFAYDKSMMVVNNITYPVSMISFPAFSKLQDYKDRLKNGFLKTIKMISILTFPCAFGQVVLGPEYINTIFGHKWQASIVIFQMILIYSMLRSISQCGTSLLNGVGRPDITLKCNLAYAPIFIGSVYLGSKVGGLYGIGLVTSLVGSIWAIVFISIVVRKLKWRIGDIIDALKASFLSSIIMGAVIFLLKLFLKNLNFSNILILIILMPIGVLTYALSIKLFFQDTYEFILDSLQKFLNKENKIKNVLQKQRAEEA
ncbi:MAG: hypothetical protein A2287_02915 [Candidatus Melainabacteria bacterium RIFOXYA12_FULL_32_12]|nr:MAG: hypothetical protein A2255_06790 [Candidatus Melainabacteria bacterium RIFOXYA2_FULL_32_9]OGI29334.1 MAG: hypothetical protein A2287_02915 [Candidatus Melainabacteria bacterium RIFOXYA12_FULL_32_12]